MRQARIEAMRQIVREGIESGPGVPGGGPNTPGADAGVAPQAGGVDSPPEAATRSRPRATASGESSETSLSQQQTPGIIPRMAGAAATGQAAHAAAMMPAKAEQAATAATEAHLEKAAT